MATAPPTDATDAIIKEPIDMLRLSLDDRVYVKCRYAQPASYSLPPAHTPDLTRACFRPSVSNFLFMVEHTSQDMSWPCKRPKR